MVKKTLRKPEYWENFEDLCKRLWGEIWECPEIKKNGRIGQVQNGVDIIGTDKITDYLIGIQCKGKDEYNHSLLTVQEIDAEIEKAKTFKPPLNKFYFATTANKDSKIEEYVRIKNQTNKESGFFEVHLFSWGDIVELIDVNRKTHNWYINNLNFKTEYDVILSFDNDSDKIIFEPIFIEERTKYDDSSKLKNVKVDTVINQVNTGLQLFNFDKKVDSNEDLINFINDDLPQEKEDDRLDPQPISFEFSDYRMIPVKISNKSVCCFRLKLKNTGTEVLEDIKVYLSIDNVYAFDSVDKRKKMFDTFKYSYNVFINEQDSLKATFEPEDRILVQGDFLLTDELCIRSKTEPSVCVLDYELVSRNFSKIGKLTIEVNPKLDREEFTKYVDNPEQMEDELFYYNKYLHEE